MYAIETNKLTKRYNKKVTGAKSVSLTVEEGEIFGFIGPNGAGKSTVIKMLMNIIFPTGGSAKILGLDCVKESEEIKELVSYVPAEVNYYDYMKVKDLLKFSASFVKSDTKKLRADLCKTFELDVDRKIKQLSLGNRKKVAIIQALLSSPKLIILDEPTSGLDPLMQTKLFQLLVEQKEKGNTVFLSSHNLADVERYCDRVGIINDGKIVEVSKIEEVIKRKIIRVKTKSGEHKSFQYDGDVNFLMSKLVQMDLKDIEITHMSLEQEFMKFYDKDGGEQK